MAEDSDNTARIPTDRVDQLVKIEGREVDLGEETSFRPVPHAEFPWGTEKRVVWRVEFELVHSPSVSIGLDINDDVVLGRGGPSAELIDLQPYEAEALGVSRRHALLRPTATKLYVLDLGSTNGTLRNDRSIGINTPYSLADGDLITLGRLPLQVRIVNRPKGQTEVLHEKADLSDTLTTLAKAITAQLELEDVLVQVLELAMTLTLAGETAIWLVDEQTGELFLEAERGIDDEAIRRLRLPVVDTLAGQVIKTGKAVRTSHASEGKRIKIKTGYLVEAVLYVPLTLGGVTFGVLAAAHRVSGAEFEERDEKLLSAIADFAAIAVQNARLYGATDKALARRYDEVTTLHELSLAVSATLNLKVVHEVLMEAIGRHWQVEAAGLWLVDDETRTLVPFAPDESSQLTQQTFLMGKDFIGEVADRGEAWVGQQVDVPLGAGPGKEPITKLVAKTAAAVPLLVEDQVVGVVALFNKENGVFTQEDALRLKGFASPVATAIHNARLFAESEHERATIHATANTLTQPLMIVDDAGELVLANPAAEELLASAQQPGGDLDEARGGGPLVQLMEGLYGAVGHPTEVDVGERSFIATVNHAQDVGSIIVMHDITHVKRLEQTRAEFIDALTHDLRSPMTSIKGFAQIVPRLGDISEPGLDFLNRIVEATERVMGMVDQLLDVALLTQSPQTEHAPLNIYEAVSRAVRDLEGAAVAKSIDLGFEVTGNRYQINGDETRLYRSVLNLVDNAIKYSPEKAKVEVTLAYEKAKITIRVLDSGPGIPKDDLPHVFEKFYRGKQSDSEHPGIGIGLAMVRETVEAHGGEAWVENRKEGGVAFTITLPGSLRVKE